MKKLLLALLMIPLLAHASNWVSTGETVQGNKYFVDTESIIRNGDLVTFWDKTNLARKDDSGIWSTRTNLSMNCRTREFLRKYMMAYDGQNNSGKLTDSFPANPSTTWQPINPDSQLEAQFKFVCKR